MNKSLIFIFSFLCTHLSAQIDIKGQILFNNKPVENVTIFLNNTSKGTISNKNGEFNLDIKKGFYQLIISHIGYRTIKYELNTSDYTKPLVFSLSEEEFVLDEVVVSETKNYDTWQSNFSVFLREFIGTSKFSKYCTIINRKVLTLDFDGQNNILTAEASELLHIRNEVLGYDIYYDLEHFSVHKKITKYSGYFYFKELDGRKNKQKKWRKNRLKAYRGSPIHFYKSILNNTTKNEGFVINQFARKVNKERPNQEEIANARKLLTSSNVAINFSKDIETPRNAIDSALMVIKKIKLPKYIDYLYRSDIPSSDIISVKDNSVFLEFKDNLSIVYSKEKEEEAYILRNVFSKPRKALAQTSNIIPVAEPSIIYPTGILANPLIVIYEGYWSFEKFAHSLPLDYEPIE